MDGAQGVTVLSIRRRDDEPRHRCCGSLSTMGSPSIAVMLRVRSNESKTDVHSKKLPSARPIIRKHGFDETALLGVALMGVSASSTKYEDGRFIIGTGAHTNEMAAACNHCRHGV